MLNLFASMYTAMICGLKSFHKEECGAVDIVAIVVMIGIAVLLAVVFKNQISSLLTTLFDTITTTSQNAISG